MFEGDNGGATSRGVTETEVLIAVPSAGTTYEPHYKLLFDHFNQHYEFYGRRLRPILVPIGGADPPALRSLGAEIAGKGAFASLDYIAARGSAMHRELARQGVVTVTTGLENLLTDRTLFDPLHPYLWSVYPSAEQVWRNLADLACTSLVGRPPQHADETLQGAVERKFGIVASGSYAVPLTGALEQGLASCGARPVVVQSDQSSDSGATTLRTGLQKLKDQGVTTVVCACLNRSFASVVSTAYRETLFKPEWLLPSFTYGAASEESSMQGLNPDERRLVFGLMPFPKLLPLQSQPWFHFQEEVKNIDPGAMEAAYRMMLVLASGIQAAGPNLTSESFAAGLMATTFPNPDAGAAPFWQPSVGFGPGDHAFFDDYALAWWSNDAPPRGFRGVAGRGSWCYVGDGQRYTVGRFPADADDRFFAGESCG